MQAEQEKQTETQQEETYKIYIFYPDSKREPTLVKRIKKDEVLIYCHDLIRAQLVTGIISAFYVGVGGGEGRPDDEPV